ncbi:MAG: FG-GAP-like repeat-containing protein [Deltaproteobacteria bacterium]
MKKWVNALKSFIIAAIMVVVPAFTICAQDTVGKIPLQQGPVNQVNDFFSTQTTTFSNGVSLERGIISGPPQPPSGYELERSAVKLPEPGSQMAAKTLTVPAFNWVFGCSSVSGAMIAGYYDRNGYPYMYAGPTNGGIMPLDNSSWPTWSDGTNTYPNLPLAGSHNGVDGRVTRGSIDDYWVQYGSGASDPYITGSWTQHTWSDAIGDYMKTSQSAYSNTDGSTTFYTWTSSPDQLTCSQMADYSIHTLDGTYGRKLFYEARGYTVTDCYNQKTDNLLAGGFSFADFKSEIDAGRPVMLNLAGHTIVGVGYNDTGNTIYIHDTWDYLNHSMTWGGSYSGMQLQSVSIVNLEEPAPLIKNDFNADGRTDILLRNTTSGKNLVWFMNGVTRLSYAYLTDVTNLAWTIVGTGNFNADGKTDILWRNTSTGQNLVWFMNNISRTSLAYIPTVSDQAWTIVGTGDFNNDGKTDILWRNTTTGQIQVWYMDGVTRTSYVYLPRVADLDWIITGTGDFNQDGQTDILWRNTSTGRNQVWYMNGVTKTSAAYLTSNTDLDWAMVGTADFNADGKTDIIWRNTSTGRNMVWYMNGVTRTSYAYLLSISDQAWKIVGK